MTRLSFAAEGHTQAVCASTHGLRLVLTSALQRHGAAAALPAAAPPATQHPLLARPASAGGATAAAATATTAVVGGGASRYEAIYRAALAQVGSRGWGAWLAG